IRFNPNDGDISLQNLIEAEVSRIGALDEMNYDWQVLSQDGRSGEQSVLMVAAKTDDVNRYSDLLDEIGLTAINVDVD
ncbi:pilus assembly protein PilM, partial [Listeria monocytogenes]|nr:pilus assembly protein PilM [Listeria monocytogenes]